MKNIKIAFFDIDGTLIDMETKVITENMKNTLKRLQENGIRICIATGRPKTLLPNIMETFGLEFDAYLTFSGSYCYNNKDVIFTNTLSNKDVHQIIKNTQEINRPVAVCTKDEFGANGLDQDLVDFFLLSKINLTVSPDFDKLADEEVFQIMSGSTPAERAQLVKNTENAKVAAWWDRATDIVPANGGKGAGVAAVLKYYGLDRSEAIAFGDGNNDIEMFEAVDTPVAMGNGSDDLKAIAKDICGKVSEDGIYHYCLEKGLI